MSKAKRSTPTSIRFTITERRSLRAAARKLGLEYTTWIRQLALARAAAILKARPKKAAGAA